MLCELALVLAIDISGSVAQEHYLLQRDATAAAIEEVLRPRADLPVAIRVVMWEDRVHVVLPWEVLRLQSCTPFFTE